MIKTQYNYKLVHAYLLCCLAFFLLALSLPLHQAAIIIFPHRVTNHNYYSPISIFLLHSSIKSSLTTSFLATVVRGFVNMDNTDQIESSGLLIFGVVGFSACFDYLGFHLRLWLRRSSNLFGFWINMKRDWTQKGVLRQWQEYNFGNCRFWVWKSWRKRQNCNRYWWVWGENDLRRKWGFDGFSHSDTKVNAKVVLFLKLNF